MINLTPEETANVLRSIVLHSRSTERLRIQFPGTTIADWNEWKQDLRKTYGGSLIKVYYDHFAHLRPEVSPPIKQPIHTLSEPAPITETVSTIEEGDTKSYIIRNTPIKNKEEFFDHTGLDPFQWEVLQFRVSVSELGAKLGSKADKSEHLVVTQLYHVSAKLRERKLENGIREAVTKFIQETAATANLPVKFSPSQINQEVNDDHLVEINISDAHLGKLVWGDEVNGSNYDLKIASNAFFLTVQKLVERTVRLVGHSRLSVVLVLGNDLLHVDNNASTTTKGTNVDTDSRHKKVFFETLSLVQRIVDYLHKQLNLGEKSLRFVFVPGNHDRESIFYLSVTLNAVYSTWSTIQIEPNLRDRSVWTWGDVMVMHTHGDDIKIDALPTVMSIEFPDEWGKAKFREVHIGHLHKQSTTIFKPVVEQHGISVRVFPALSPTDTWHYGKGFVGNKVGGSALVWHKTDGLVAHLTDFSPLL